MTLAATTAPALATLGYPHSGMQCVHAPYQTSGTGYWCSGYSWGTIRDNSGAASIYSGRGYAYRNCTDYVAWKVQSLGVANTWTQGLGNGGNWYDNAGGKAGLNRGTTPKVGAAAIKLPSGTDVYGHVAYVEKVNRDANGNVTTIQVSEYNYDLGGNPNTRTGTPGAMGFTRFVYFGEKMTNPPDDDDEVPAAPSAPPPVSSNVTTIPGNWSGDSRQDFAYVTKRTDASGNDAGFDLAIWESTPTGITPQGIKWPEGSLRFDKTAFIPTDYTGDGLLDLFYATPANASGSPTAYGMTVALMINNGAGFSWGGTVWNDTGLKLADVKFVPGNFTGDHRGDFAYITKRVDASGNDAGFDVAVQESKATGIYYRGNWWPESGLRFGKTKFIPADYSGDGFTDLFYATPSNTWADPNVTGMTTSLMLNYGGAGSGFYWGGTVSIDGGLKLAETRFIPGNWSGDARGDYAYVTKRADGGITFAVQTSTATGISWGGNWWTDTNVKYDSVEFAPADYTGDGYTDLFYATPSNAQASPAVAGMTMGLQTTNGLLFDYQGTVWTQGLYLDKTMFLPGA